MEIYYILAAFILGGFIAYFLARILSKSSQKVLEEKLKILNEKEIESHRKTLEFHSTEIELNKKVSSLEVEKAYLVEKLEVQEKSIKEMQSQFSIEFENLANKIFEEKTDKFTKQNQTNLDSILSPLNERIRDFEKRVTDIHSRDSMDRAALKEQLKNLSELNQHMSKEAENLTKALKGDSKTQGTWGEFILEKVLEKSGLVKNEQYKVQESHKSENGKTYRPDVIIYLPDDKNLIVDSKVSLTAYEKYFSSDSKDKRAEYLKRHAESISNHIKELSEKNYHKLYQLNSPDFVLMFIPVEPAFALAIQTNPDLFYKAFESNIVIVSPSTLLATLRTIESIWRQEKQNKNALEIAKQSGDLYDKFVGFVDDLTDIGKRLKSTDDAYQNAMKKLYEGKGNLVRRAQNIKSLGAKTSKTLSSSLIEQSE